MKRISSRAICLMLGNLISGHHENRTRDFRFSWCFSLLGWGVPLPLPVRSRRYDDVFWKELLGGGGGEVRGAEFEGVRVLGCNNEETGK